MTGAFRCLDFVYQFSEGGMAFVGDNSDDGQIQGWTLPETEELRKHVVPIYQEEKPISESDGYGVQRRRFAMRYIHGHD
jgi:hypothetical protein